MSRRLLLVVFTVFLPLFAPVTFAYDCTDLPEWKRQHYYLISAQVQYQGIAYENTIDGSKRDRPGEADNWSSLGACDADDGGGGGGGGVGEVDPQQISIYGVWHCGNSFCDWSQVRDTSGEFHLANSWIIDRNADGIYGDPSVNLVVLSFLKPMELLNETDNGAFTVGIPTGMTPTVVKYFKDHDIRVLLSMGGVTYTDSWNQALVTDPAGLAEKAFAAVRSLGADGLEIDWENGRPNDTELEGIETFIDTYNELNLYYGTQKVLTLDLAVGTRYLQELSRRAAADWLPNGKISYINAMVARGEPSIDQWQEHVDGKANYDPPIPPKAPAKVAVSLWLTDGRKPNDNCVDFEASSQLAKADYVQTVQPNGAGTTHGFLGYMFWAAECPSTRNVCTTPPNSCEGITTVPGDKGGMGVGATHFNIPIPLDFGTLRTD
jgi:hypothetical protein